MAVTKRTETGQKEEEQKGLEKNNKTEKKNNNYHKKNKAIMIPEGFICNCQAGNL